MNGTAEVAGHAFISYVREDAEQVDHLQTTLEAAGVRVWRDTEDLWPGEDWRAKIRAAITDDALVFIACFSSRSAARLKSYQNEELTLAIDQLRLRHPDEPWLIPVRFDNCSIPELDLGAGRTLRSLQYIDLFGAATGPAIVRLVTMVLRILGRSNESDETAAQSQEPVGPVRSRPAADGSPTGHGTADGARKAPEGAAFTGRWRHTTNGIEAAPLMNMSNTSMPGYDASPDVPPAFVRVGVCMACDPIAPDASSSLVGTRFINFLSREPVAGLISQTAESRAEQRWTRLAGNGALRLDAVLRAGDDEGRPVASAMLLPPETGMQQYGRVDGLACFWLHLELSADGHTAPPAGLAQWYERLRRAVSLAGAFEAFLSADIGLATRDASPARVGVLVQAQGSISDLFDVGDLRELPGGYQSAQFLGYAIADPGGKSEGDVGCDLLRQICDHTLHLADFEPVLAALAPPKLS